MQNWSKNFILSKLRKKNEKIEKDKRAQFNTRALSPTLSLNSLLEGALALKEDRLSATTNSSSTLPKVVSRATSSHLHNSRTTLSLSTRWTPSVSTPAIGKRKNHA